MGCNYVLFFQYFNSFSILIFFFNFIHVLIIMGWSNAAFIFHYFLCL
jgi:hypothetical protein